MALEPRLMYDGAAAAGAAAAVHHHTDAAACETHSSSTSPPGLAACADHAQSTTGNAGSITTGNQAQTPCAVPPPEVNASGAAAAAPSTGAGQQIVFIDSNVPDAQLLAQGVQPGITVVMLNPNSNGVQQIADYLSDNNIHNLAAIQIVSHGEDATVRLGDTIFGLADISLFSQQLATIGQALQPGGDILFYGCNVGEGAEGALFEVELSQATGGAHVAASSGLVGSADQAGSWNLDVADGTIDVGNPFTAATLASFEGVLTNEIWFTTPGASNSPLDQVGHIDVSGSSGSNDVTVNADSTTSTVFNTPTGIALDAAVGKYFVVDSQGNSSVPQRILEGSINGGPLTTIYTDTANGGGDIIQDVVFDAQNSTLYFSVNEASGGTTNTSGIFSIAVGAGGAVASNVVPTTVVSSANAAVPFGLAVDAPDNLLFFTNGNIGAGTVEVANLTTGAIVDSDIFSASSASQSTELVNGIAVDPTDRAIFWVTSDSATVGNNDIFRESFTSSSPGLFTAGTQTDLFAASSTVLPNVSPNAIDVDTADGIYYAAFGSSTGAGTIVEGSLTSAATPTTVFSFTGTNQAPNVLEFEAAPTLSVTASGATAVENGAATILAGSVSVAELRQSERHQRHLRRHDSRPPRIGLKGTAKIYGPRVTLFYYIMRRPLAALRQLVGL
jgi:hypothetical protein